MKKIIVLISTLILLFFGLILKEAIDVNKQEIFNIHFQPEQTCQLQTHKCLVEIPKLGKAEFSLSPQPIKMNAEIQMKLSPNFSKEIEVWVDFLGMEMDMGYNRTQLEKVGNHYSGLGFLPTCTAEFMNWKTTLIIKTDDKTYGYVFKFLTQKDE